MIDEAGGLVFLTIGTAITTNTAPVNTNPARTGRRVPRPRSPGPNPDSASIVIAARVIAPRLVTYSRNAPCAWVVAPTFNRTPIDANGGTSATATATPGSTELASR